jgi:uncharacterized protein
MPSHPSRRPNRFLLVVTFSSIVVSANGDGSDPRELERRCEAGQARECVSLGILYAEGKSVVADPQRALTLFTQACDRGDLMGCNAQGRMLAQGEPRDVPKAHALYDRACRGGYFAGCFNLGQALATGHGEAKDSKRAVPLFKRACDGQLSIACTNLGALYVAGDGVPADETRAFELFKRGCDGGDPKGCANLAKSHNEGRGTAKDVETAARYFDKACDGGEGTACNELSLMYFKGAGVDQDLARGNALTQRACELDKEYCSDAFFKRLREILRKKPLDELSTDCDRQSMEACNALAEKYASGDGIPKDLKKAVSLYKKGCAAGDRRACAALQQLRP